MLLVGSRNYIGSYDDWYDLLEINQTFHSAEFLLKIKIFGASSVINVS